jgi:pimeloyl-ACP methyl ester carboxylesterase
MGGVFVLVHGAFDGGWIWRRVAARLRAKGHEVWTPTLTGSGERFHLLTRETGLSTHVADITALLEHEDLHDVVLVGHSYGGAVVTAVADKASARIAKLVYLDASALSSGQAASGAFAEGTADALAAMGKSTQWLLPPLPLSALEVHDAADVAWIEPRRHAHPLRSLHEPLHLTPGVLERMPTTYVQCTRHAGLAALFGVDPLAPFVDRARSLGWRHETIDAGHAVMVTHPERVAELLASHA